MARRRSAIVVGGAGGIGAAVCTRLADAGIRVVVADLHRDRAEAMVGTLAGSGHVAEAVDVTDQAQVAALFDRVEADEPAAILVTIVGGPLADPAKPSRVGTMTLDEWERTFRFNVTGMFLCVGKFSEQRLAVPIEHSRIVTFGSITGQVGGGPTGVAYPTAKAAVFGFTRHVAGELAPAGITVNSIAPGAVGTPEFYRLTTPEYAASVGSSVPLGRVGTPEEVAGMVAFLVSEEASYVTGATLDVNGGFVMR